MPGLGILSFATRKSLNKNCTQPNDPANHCYYYHYHHQKLDTTTTVARLSSFSPVIGGQSGGSGQPSTVRRNSQTALPCLHSSSSSSSLASKRSHIVSWTFLAGRSLNKLTAPNRTVTSLYCRTHRNQTSLLLRLDVTVPTPLTRIVSSPTNCGEESLIDPHQTFGTFQTKRTTKQTNERTNDWSFFPCCLVFICRSGFYRRNTVFFLGYGSAALFLLLAAIYSS